MQTRAPTSNSLLSLLQRGFQHGFSQLLHPTPDTFSHPLLDTEEIQALRSRVLTHKQKPLTRSHDTNSQRMGDKRSTHRGYGMDYEESRAYQAGDDPRYLNWALSARTDELHTKVFREESANTF